MSKPTNHSPILMYMNSRRKFLLQGSLATTAILATKPFKTFAKLNSSFSFTDNNSISLLHTYGLGVTATVSPAAFEKAMSVIAELKKQKAGILLFDTGNSFTDARMNALLQPLGYDALIPGDRDLASGQFLLPAIASNYLVNDSNLKNIQPYKIIYKNDIRIGIISACSNTGSGAVSFKDPAKEITALATHLKEAEHCGLVICLSNLDHQNKKPVDDLALALQSKNVDVILGSQSAQSSGKLPAIVINKMKQEVIVNNAGYGDILLGRVQISFDGDNKKNKIAFSNIPMGSGYGKAVQSFM
ncbi:MAG: hypothetical protein ABJA78_04900 [Ferruginibacter sp.]